MGSAIASYSKGTSSQLCHLYAPFISMKTDRGQVLTYDLQGSVLPGTHVLAFCTCTYTVAIGDDGNPASSSTGCLLEVSLLACICQKEVVRTFVTDTPLSSWCPSELL